MTAGFDRHPLLCIADDGVTFAVVGDSTYTGSQGDSWTVPDGFETDFASIPAAVSWAIPKLGAYSLAAIVHDLLCVGLNNWHAAAKAAGTEYARTASMLDGVYRLRFKDRWVEYPSATAVDTDAIFRKIARSYGTDPVTAALLWTGVRWGALFNPARRDGWLKTAPAVLGLSLLFSPVLVPATVLALGGRAILRAARALFRKESRS